MVKDPILDIVLDSVREVVDFQLANFRGNFKVEYKSNYHDLVTEVDIQSQAILERNLLQNMVKNGFDPLEIGFIGEEGLNSPKKFTFILDPLDGTSNYTSGFQFFSIMVAFFEDGQLKFSLIYEPFNHTYYFALKNQGAYKFENSNLEKLEIKSKPVNQLSILTSKKTISKLNLEVLNQCRDIKFLGGIGLEVAYLCRGVFDGLISTNSRKSLYIWDFAPTKLLVEESGGLVVDQNGKNITINPYQLSETSEWFIWGNQSTVNLLISSVL